MCGIDDYKTRGTLIILEKIIFLNEFLRCNDCFGFLPKSKRGLGLAFGTHFLHDFLVKMFLM